jgi:hypothetical protein
MDEADWLARDDPVAMLAQFIPPGGRSSRTGHKLNSFPTTDRKLRLFAVACCRQVWYLLTDECSRRAVEVAERYADGLATAEELDRAALGVAGVPGRTNAPLWCCALSTDFVLRNVPRACGVPPTAQAALLRCVFGNPFRPKLQCRCDSSIQPHDAIRCPLSAWTNDRVMHLARGIYEDRAFEDLPILADALEEAGCPAEGALLSHLRERPRRWWHQAGVLCADPTPPHARGCWCVDLILGKT